MSEPIGHDLMDAVLAVTDELMSCVREDFGPNEGVYRVSDCGGYVSEEDWETVWANHPAWWRDAWLLADNGQLSAEDVSRMSVHEIERAVASPDFYPEYAFYTETDEEGEL